MIPTSFDEANHIIDKPDDMTREQCGPLNVWAGEVIHDDFITPVMISCWKMTAEELKEVNRTGRIWVWHYGDYLQPHSATGISPFENQP